MSLSNPDLTRLLLALILILAVAHGCGYLFARLHQPRVAGEILGGLLLGPTVFERLAPQVHAALFHTGAATAPVLGALYQLGLFLLMFCSGATLRSGVKPGERRTTVVIATLGNLLPFSAGILLWLLVKPANLLGPANNQAAFMLIFGCAIAVTSVPVISKIMADLGILGTSFARIVLGVAVFEDVVLFIVVSVALGMVQSANPAGLTLPSLLGIRPDTLAASSFYVGASAAFFSLPLLLGRDFMNRVASMRGNVLAWSSPVAFQLLFVLAITALALFLGVAAYFGAFVAGILAGRRDGVQNRAHDAITSFSFAVFVPLYFAIVGMQLDLLHHFDLVFFVWFLASACIAKAGSVFFGARLAGQPRASAATLAVALNARGGPAIVLASVSYAAHIIDESFYVSLVMLALVTSTIAGAWLDGAMRRRALSDDLAEDAPESLASARLS